MTLQLVKKQKSRKTENNSVKVGPNVFIGGDAAIGKKAKVTKNSKPKSWQDNLIVYMIISILIIVVTWSILEYPNTKPNLDINVYEQDHLKDFLEAEGFKTFEEALDFAEKNMDKQEANDYKRLLGSLKQINKNEVSLTLSNSNEGIALVKDIYVEILNYSIVDTCGGGVAYCRSSYYVSSVKLNSNKNKIRAKNFTLAGGCGFDSKEVSPPLFTYNEGASDIFNFEFYPESKEYNISEKYFIRLNVIWCDSNNCIDKTLTSRPIEILFFKLCDYDGRKSG